MILSIEQGMKAEGFEVPISKLCRWFGLPRRTFYYPPTKAPPKVQERFSGSIKEMIEQEPSFGYRTVAGLLGFNKNTVQRISRSRAGRFANGPWDIDLGSRHCLRWRNDRVWAGQDHWVTLAVVMDCCTRELLGWPLSRSGRSRPAEAALEQALISRYGSTIVVPNDLVLRSDNGLVFTSRSYRRLVRSYGIRQEFIQPHCPQQNGMVERLIRSIKEQCVHRHRFESIPHANRVIGD